MASDVDNNIISIKQKLNNSINHTYFDYIKQLINKNVEDCNLLYTQVCYLVKLFLLNDYESNNGSYNDYKFDELFIRKCFGLIKNGKINKRNGSNDDKDKDKDKYKDKDKDKDKEKDKDNDNDKENNKDNSLINRLINFYNQYNLNENNIIKFISPDEILSISHITDALSRDIKTNITNNIKTNYYKYVKEYVNINLKVKFKNIDTNKIYKIYDDIINNTLHSDIDFHSWISEHKKLIMPSFDKTIHIKNFDDGILNHKSIFIKFINTSVKDNQKLLNLISINGDNKNKTIKYIIEKLVNDYNNLDNLNNYDDWINENKNIIVNDFNLNKKIDIDKELTDNPYQFIKYMLFINRNLELNGSKKKYQIIPLRTNLTPKFIPIGIDAFVDILNSEYLFGKNKNYYHDDNKNGLILFETYFRFDSKYILNILKKGYVFSGLIYTDGHEINYIFNSKSYKTEKNNFHSKGKENKKFIKENTKGLNDEQKEEFINKYNEDKELEKKEKIKLYNQKNQTLKNNQKNEYNKILKALEGQLVDLKKTYEDNLDKIEKEHYINLKLEFDKIDKTNEDKKKLMNEVNERLNNKLISNKVYLTFQYERNCSSLINDYNNTVDIKYEEIKNKQLKNDELIKKIKEKIYDLKTKLKKLNKYKFNDIKKQYKKETKKINIFVTNHKNNKKKLKRLIDKMKEKLDLLNYETVNNKSLTFKHIINIKENLSKILLKIKQMNIYDCLNNYLNSLGDINKYLLTNSSETIKNTLSLCFKYLSVEEINKDVSLNLKKLLNSRLKKIEQKERIKDNEWYINSNNIKKELDGYSKELNKLMNEKKQIDNELIKLFKDKNNENIKVDNMSKKLLSVLNKMNWAVIDPGVNSLLTILSKDGKTMFSYSKSEYLSRTQRKKRQNRIEKIKKEKITEVENKLTKEKSRLKTSNYYKNFNEYFTLKMEIHNEITKLYKDERLIKLKWHSFINDKRSESYLVNKIKKKFGNDIVLILGDWSMNKSGLKNISTPNKKYENLLNKHFKVFKLSEFRTSIIENKTELKCENLIKKINYENMGIKEIFSLEKLKEKNKEKYLKKITDKKVHKILTCKTSPKFIKYINRDTNAVKNMLKIVSEYISTNKKPIIFVMGTKICNNAESVM